MTGERPGCDRGVSQPIRSAVNGGANSGWGVALQSSLCRSSVQTSIRVNPQFEAASPRATSQKHRGQPRAALCRSITRRLSLDVAQPYSRGRRYSVRPSIALRPRSDWPPAGSIASTSPAFAMAVFARPLHFPSAFALAIPSRCLSNIRAG
jgi:hypothetical protein